MRRVDSAIGGSNAMSTGTHSMDGVYFTVLTSSIANKLARGKFAATFFFASLAEIGCDTVRLVDV